MKERTQKTGKKERRLQTEMLRQQAKQPQVG